MYPIGSVTVRAMVHETHLRVEILNARHLKPLETQRVQTSVAPSKDSTNQGQEKRPTPLTRAWKIMAFVLRTRQTEI